MGKCGVYKISLRGQNRHYIGQSVDLWKRLRTHLALANRRAEKRKFRITRAIRKYGAGAFDFSVLAFCDPGSLDGIEAYFIQVFNSVSQGFNIAEDPCAFGRGRVVSDAEKKQIVERNTGSTKSTETREKMRQSAKDRHASEGHKLNDKPQWIREVARNCPKRWKAVQQISLAGALVKEFPSIKSAAKETGLVPGNIVKVVKGQLGKRTCGGFIWQYAPSYAN